jgi:hypothetical protein
MKAGETDLAPSERLFVQVGLRFESGFLQRRVRCELDTAAIANLAPAERPAAGVTPFSSLRSRLRPKRAHRKQVLLKG